MGRITFYKFLSVPVFGLLYLYTAILVITGLPFVFLRRKHTVRFMMRLWAKGIFALMGKRLNHRGMENTKDSWHFVLVANHSSLFDIIAIISLFPDVAWFGHERLLRIPVFRRVLILTGYIPMRKATLRNTREMISRLVESSKHNNIAIFPEGTRSLNGKVNDFYRGFILLLRSSEVDVLPVTLNGFYSLKPKNRFYINFSSRLEAVIHTPVKRDYLVTLSDGKITGMIKTIIESSLSGNLYLSDEELDINTNLIKA
jgi:1-acyl-sn-glycerol-3-phosphate acyltransferase